MSMKVLRCLGIRKRHMARKSPCFLRFLSSRSGPNVPHFFLSFLFHAASLLSWPLLVKIPSHGYDIFYALFFIPRNGKLDNLREERINLRSTEEEKERKTISWPEKVI